MEKESENNKSTTDEVVGESNQSTSAPDDSTQPLYFTKDGKVQFGVTPPTAFALSYPYPPLPSNLAKNRVLRASDDQTKESLQEGITEGEKEFGQEAMPLSIQGLPKVLIPEIELALYWDRHPYEFRVPEKGQSKQQNSHVGNKNNHNISAFAMRKSKSEMNLASKVGKVLLEEQAESASSSNSRRSSVSASNKTSRSADESNELGNSSHYQGQLTLLSNGNCSNRISNGNRCVNGKCGSGRANDGRRNSANNGNHAAGGDDGARKKLNSAESGKSQYSVAKLSASENANETLQLNEGERKKFEDIKLFHHQGQNHLSRPKLMRSQDQLESNNTKKAAGVQVSIDDVTAAALKSTYLCPLHGQYRRGIERRDKGGFRTDMVILDNSHTQCSRALKGKPSRTKMIKTVETQTDGEAESSQFQSIDDRINRRSKTAGHERNSRKGKAIMASEYHGSFKDPYKIAESEKRHLRNKILDYCFTKHSIF